MKIRKLLAVLLAGAMLLAALPAAVFAEEIVIEAEALDEALEAGEIAEEEAEPADLFIEVEADGEDEDAPAPVEEDEIVAFAEPAEPTGAGEPEANAEGVAIDEAHFPDAIFRAWVADNADADKDGALSAVEAAAVTDIELIGDAPASLKGIEQFTALKVLSTDGYKLASLDLSANTKLEELYCYTLAATELDLSDNTALVTVALPDSSLKSLDLGGQAKLKSLNVEGSGQLASLDLKGNSELTYLNCAGCKLTELDLEWNMALVDLFCYGCALKTLDVSELTLLEQLNCSNNGLTQLKLGSNEALFALSCEFNSIPSLDLSGLSSLEYLNCAYNKLKALDVDRCTKLYDLSCQGNALEQLSVWNCPRLAEAVNAGKPSVETDFDYDDNYIGVFDRYYGDDAQVKVDHDLAVYGEKPSVSNVWLDRAAMIIYVEDEAQLTATVVPVTPINALVTWTSSDEEVAVVEDGKVTALASGKATITATSVANPAKQATCAVTVQSKTVTKALKKTGSNGTVKLNKGRQVQLEPTFAEDKGWTVKSYKTSNKKIASVTQEGLVVAKKAGKATITVRTKNNKTARVVINVQDPTVPKKITLNKKKKATVNLGSFLYLKGTMTPDTAVSKLKWKTSNRRAATVSQNGVVTPVKAGTTVITVTTENGKSAKVTVTVVDPTVPTKVKLNKSSTITLKKGETYQLKATLTPDTAVTTLKWKSSKKSVATVSGDGLVEAKKKGTTTITVSTKNGKTAKVKVRVK